MADGQAHIARRPRRKGESHWNEDGCVPPHAFDLTARERYPWRVKCDTCGWGDTFATKAEAEQRASAHSQGPDGSHLVRSVSRV